MSGYRRHRKYPELFQKGGSSRWWAFIPNPAGGRKLREPTGHQDAEAAHQWYLRRVRSSPDQTKERTLGKALQDRIDWLKSARKINDPSRKKLSEATISFYTKKSRHLVRLLGEHTLLSEISHETVREYIIKRTDEGAVGSTISKELTALSRAMTMAKKDGVNCESFRDIKPDDFVLSYVPKSRFLPRPEYDRFMRWWYAHRLAERGAILDFIVSTGATYPSEVVRASRADIDGFNVHIKGTKRAARDRTLTVPSDRRDLFERALKFAPGGETGPLFRGWGNIRRDILIACAYLSMCGKCQRSHNLWWHDAENDLWQQGTHQVMGTPSRDPKCQACKGEPVFQPFCPTDLRRTYAQWLCGEGGVPYELVYPTMGHADDKMLKLVYGRREATTVAPLIEAALKRGRTGTRAGTRLAPQKMEQADAVDTVDDENEAVESEN